MLRDWINNPSPNRGRKKNFKCSLCNTSFYDESNVSLHKALYCRVTGSLKIEGSIYRTFDKNHKTHIQNRLSTSIQEQEEIWQKIKPKLIGVVVS